MPDMPPPRKPPRRLWRFAPYGVLVAAALLWSGSWLAARQALESRMDAAQATLVAQGWHVAWGRLEISGYPFRLWVRLDQTKIDEPSGWGLAAPKLEAEAYAFAPDHWVMLAPQGLTLSRPKAGAVGVAATVLKASFARAPAGVPQMAFEAQGLVLTPAPYAKPAAITGADHLAVYVRPLADDRAEFQVQLGQARPTPGGLLARIAADQPIGLTWDEILNHASAVRGPDWAGAVRHWRAAGGGLTLVHGEIDASGVTVTALSGRGSVDSAGRLEGAWDLDLSHGADAPRRVAGALITPPLARAQLSMSEGVMRLGPFRLGDAPRLY